MTTGIIIQSTISPTDARHAGRREGPLPEREMTRANADAKKPLLPHLIAVTSVKYSVGTPFTLTWMLQINTATPTIDAMRSPQNPAAVRHFGSPNFGDEIDHRHHPQIRAGAGTT